MPKALLSTRCEVGFSLLAKPSSISGVGFSLRGASAPLFVFAKPSRDRKESAPHA